MSVSAAGPSSASTPATFEIKSAQLPLVAMLVKTADWSVLAADLTQQYGKGGESADFFDEDALVIDVSHLDAPVKRGELTALIPVLRSCRLLPVAVRGADAALLDEAKKLELVESPPEVSRPRAAPSEMTPVEPLAVQEVIREVVREAPAHVTMVMDKPLRSGQKIYARGGDLVVLAMVNQGAEVVADGNIHVYAPLRGKAMAGARGNTNARIFSLCLEPELISIAGVYRTSENALPLDVRGKAAQVRLSNDGQDKLIIEALKN
jgi:septum site-determining protein MinC